MKAVALKAGLPLLAALIMFSAPAAGRPSCGDTLTSDGPGADTRLFELSRGRLAGELELPATVARDPALRREIDRRTEAERRRLVRAAAARPRADGRICWLRSVSLRHQGPRAWSVLLLDMTETEMLGRPEQRLSSVLWDRARRSPIPFTALFQELAPEGPTIRLLRTAALDALAEAKKEGAAGEMKAEEREAYGAAIRRALLRGPAFTLEPAGEGNPATGLALHFGSGILGSRMEHSYELLIPASRLGERLSERGRLLLADAT